jgi:hypothetical protein
MRRSLFALSVATGLAALGVAAVLAGCATSAGTLPTPGQLASGADMASLRRGRALAVTDCTSCHRLYWPREYQPDEWPRIVREMAGLMSLSKTQVRDLTLYFRAASQAEHGESPRSEG